MRYNITLKSITPLIFSNRMNDALYKGIDFNKYESEEEFKELSNTNIVYQFSCYEDRALKLDKKFSYADSYYISASSIKGALCLDEKYRNIKFKDIEVKKEMIGLSKLNKFQYLYQDEDYENKKNNDENAKPKEIKYTHYFPNIMIEMLKSGEYLSGEIISKGDNEIDYNNIVEKVDLKTRRKLSEYLNRIEKIYNKDFFKELNKINNNTDTDISKFKRIECSIKNLLNQKNIKIAFVGGFKGLIGGLNNCEFDKYEKIRSGFYIDEETMLPYGLVELDITEK